MVEAINTWLNNGCNYAEGVSLYALYGNDIFLKLVLKRGETAANRQKLNAALTALLDTAEPEPAPAPTLLAPIDLVKSIESACQERAPVEEVPNQTPALLQVIKERKRTIAEIQSLHPQLSVLPEGPGLYELARHLVIAGKLNAQQWEKYNNLTDGGVEHAQNQPPPPPPVMVDLHLLQKREAVRKSLNKAENRKKKLDKPNKNTLELIEQRRKDLRDIDAKIAAIKKEAGQ